LSLTEIDKNALAFVLVNILTYL